MIQKKSIKALILQGMTPIKVDHRNKILYFEVLKIISAFLVVFYHFAFYKMDYGFIESSVYIPNINRIVMSFAACSVPIFFGVNGVLLFKKERDWKEIYAKVIKIIVLMLIWKITAFPAWFLGTLVILYLMFPAFQYISKKYVWLYYSICMVVFFMPFLYNFCLMVLKALRITMFGGIFIDGLRVTGCFTMYSILYFLLFPIVDRNKEKYKFLGFPSVFLGWTLLLIECTVYTNLNQKMHDGVNDAFPTIGAFFLAVGVYLIISNGNLEKYRRIITELGEAVLPVYLMHMIWGKLFNKVFAISDIGLCGAVIYTMAIYVVCALVGKIMKKLPIVCWTLKM